MTVYSQIIKPERHDSPSPAPNVPRTTIDTPFDDVMSTVRDTLESAKDDEPVLHKTTKIESKNDLDSYETRLWKLKDIEAGQELPEKAAASRDLIAATSLRGMYDIKFERKLKYRDRRPQIQRFLLQQRTRKPLSTWDIIIFLLICNIIFSVFAGVMLGGVAYLAGLAGAILLTAYLFIQEIFSGFGFLFQLDQAFTGKGPGAALDSVDSFADALLAAAEESA